MNFKHSICAIIICTLAVIMAMPMGVWGQTTPAPPLATFGAGYIRIDLGDFFIVNPGQNQQVVHGSYMISTQKGDPDTAGDDFSAILYGYWKIKVGTQVRVIGDTASGSWTKAPTVYLFPQPGLGLGKTGGYLDAEWTTTEITPGVTVKVNLRISIIRDQIRFEVTATNLGKTSMSLGIEHHGTVTPSDSRTIGYPFIPGRGVVRYGGTPERPVGMLLNGSTIPNYFDIYDDLEKPCIVPRVTLGLEDATRPDYLAIGDHYVDFFNLATWIPDDFTPEPSRVLDTIAYISCWSPKSLSANASRKVITYCGCGAASSRWTTRMGRNIVRDSVALAIQAPRAFKYDELTGTNDLDPSSITIKAYVNNLATDPGPYALKNATAVLYLPRGLTLASTETAQKSIGAVPINSESLPVQWRIQPTGFYCGNLEYYVSVSDTKGWQQTVARTVLVPATKKNVFRSGWQLMHVPFSFSNPLIQHVFNMNLNSFTALYWDPVQSPVNNNSYLSVSNLQPGKSFWMRLKNPDLPAGTVQQFSVDSTGAIAGASVGKQIQDQYVEVEPGWNMIGNPFVYPVYWGQVQVYHPVSNTTVTLDQAIANKWISKTLFAWNPDKGTYDYIKTNDAMLDPWKGYWLQAYQPVSLVFRPAVFPEADVTASPSGS